MHEFCRIPLSPSSIFNFMCAKCGSGMLRVELVRVTKRPLTNIILLWPSYRNFLRTESVWEASAEEKAQLSVMLGQHVAHTQVRWSTGVWKVLSLITQPHMAQGNGLIFLEVLLLVSSQLLQWSNPIIPSFLLIWKGDTINISSLYLHVGYGAALDGLLFGTLGRVLFGRVLFSSLLMEKHCIASSHGQWMVLCPV